MPSKDASERPAPKGDAEPVRDPISNTSFAKFLRGIAEQVIAAVLAAPFVGIGTVLAVPFVGWLTTSISESPLTALLCFFGIMSFICMYLFYFHVLGASADPKGSSKRQAFDKLQQRLEVGGTPALFYTQQLSRFLDTVDRFFGDAGVANQVPSLFPPCLRLRTPAPLWTAPALDRCLLLALVYPIATIFILWLISGHVGPAERSLHLDPNLAAWQRAYTGVVVAVLILLAWWSMQLRGWKSFKGIFITVVFIFLVAAFLYILGVFIGSATFAVAVTLAFTITYIFAIATAATPAGVVAIASIFALVFIGTLVYIGSTVFVGAIRFPSSLVLTNTLALAGALIVAGAVAVVNKIAIKTRRQGVFLSIVLPAMIVACLGGASLLAPLDKWGEVVGPMLLFLGLFTLLNAPFDWVSLGLTRALLRRGLECGGWWPCALALVDAVFATILTGVLVFAMVIGVQAYDRLAAQGGGACILPLEPLFNGIETDPTAPRYWWIYILLLSTMMPSLINLAIGGLSLVRGLPGVSTLLLRQMPAGNALPVFNRHGITCVLTFQFVGGIGLGLAALLGILWLVFFHVMPGVGLELFDMSRYYSRRDLPTQLWQSFGGTGVVNCSEFELEVDALTNCFDIRTQSIQEIASKPISSGSYQVYVKESDARYCSVSECKVPKVMIYVTTQHDKEGWFNVVKEDPPITIDVSGIGVDGNKVYAFYVDITCGDNSGRSVLSFKATPGLP